MRFHKIVRLEAPPESVWPLVAHTDRLNRELGLPEVAFSFRPRPDGGTSATGSVRLAGRELSYRELPFEWVRPKHYQVRRLFEAGPIRQMEFGVVLRPAGEGTELDTWIDLVPRGPSGVVCAAFGRRAVSQMARVFGGFDAYLRRQSPSAYPRHANRPPVRRERLEYELESLRRQGVPEVALAGLSEHLSSALPEELVNFRASELADALGVDRRELLRACLLGAKGGLLEMRWRVLCPYCRGSEDSVGTLGQLRSTVHCHSCAIRYDSTFDENVEVCFSVGHTVRKVRATTYCVGGPGLSPHVVAQWAIEPGGLRRETLDLPPGTYHLTSLQVHPSREVSVDDGGAASVGWNMLPEGFRVDHAVVAPDAAWTLTNERMEMVVVRLESAEWSSRATTAAEVTTMQEFRDQFSSEVLAAGTELAVHRVCLLFTDLKGSTQMYQERGDAPSYAAVRDHFGELHKAVVLHHGSVVKTIGDAMMAAFHDPESGLRAALDIQRREDPLTTKIGLHCGPALVVNANGSLDYFGRTVNFASRLQKLSRGGDVVISAELLGDPGVRRAVDQSLVEGFTDDVPGVGEALPLLRVMPASG